MKKSYETLLLYARVNPQITFDGIKNDLNLSGAETFKFIEGLLKEDLATYGEDGDLIPKLSIEEMDAKLASCGIFYDAFTDEDLDYFAEMIKPNVINRLFALQLTTGMKPEVFLQTDNKVVLSRIEILRKYGVVIYVNELVRCAMSPEDLRKLKAKRDAVKKKREEIPQKKGMTYDFKGLPFADDEEEE